jgi:putative FmdB family regulatory protein
MPIYEYACDECGQRFEAWQKITEPAITVCEACGKPRAQRVISASSFALKGSGWYATDYARKSGKSNDAA